MKNLTAHYNIYYNASEMLRESEENIQNSIHDDYSQFLKLFPLPDTSVSTAETENLNQVIDRANRIALEKYESNWVDDAFLLLAKAEYYKGNYYNAAEYFDYVAQNFREEPENTVDALIWQAKTFFALQQYADADRVLKIASEKNLKTHADELNAAIANSYIHKKDFTTAAEYLSTALDKTKSRYSRIRWTYLLAQLQEANNKPEEAYESYIKVAKSNAAFEMSFNANLSMIRLKENSSGTQFDKIATLERLLKEDKNQEFKDQIYYQIARTYQTEGQLELANQYYEISAHTEPGSEQQKGLSYLKMAEIQFDSLKNYVKAQLYYDSTLQYLPKDYPGYATINLKAKNLQYLAERLTTIEEQKELLMLADMDEAERTNYVNEKIQSRMIAIDSVQNQIANAGYVSINDFSRANRTGGTFYFDNNLALSQGLSEFKTRWGNRKLEDNWRVSAGIGGQNIAQNVNTGDIIENAVNSNLSTVAENLDSLRQQMLQQIPLSTAQKAVSQNKIKVAQYEIALFYKDILKDNAAAIEVIEELLPQYQANDAKVAELYYQLYRLYQPINSQQSNLYKQELIKKFPSSIFSKALLNPDFGKETEAAERRLKAEYAAVYQLYKDKKYAQVISTIDSLNKDLSEFPKQGIQFSYLQALAVGHLTKAPIFVGHLQGILDIYQSDTTLRPVIAQQLAYIEQNKEAFDQRPTALLSYDANEIQQMIDDSKRVQYVIPKAEPEKVVVKVPSKTKEESKPASPAPVNVPAATQPEPKPVPQPEESIAAAPKETTETVRPTEIEKQAEVIAAKPAEAELKEKEEPVKPKGISFVVNDRIKHAIVIDVTDSKKNIARPFASITKYFYSKFVPSDVLVNIRTIGNDKLIIVRAGLNSNDIAKRALEELRPSLTEMMEMPESEFRTFVISEPNLLLIQNAESLNQYLNFIK